MRNPGTISGAAKLAGVMGWPVAHSRSPALHGFWLREHGIDGAYVPLPVKPENLRRALQDLPLLGFAGCNITIPHKEDALKAVDEYDPTARRVGAVNTIVVGPNGAIEGRNTDGFGFLESLRAAVKGWRAAAGPAVVLGAGGAARAIVAALIDDGAPEIRLVNRTPERAAKLAKALAGPVRGVAWEERAKALAGAALLVNATSLGMTGQPALELPLDALPENAVVNDIVYVPITTPLLAAARARGNPAVDGLDMLLHQGRPGFAAWFGVMPEVTPALRRAVLDTLNEP
jgi:shikimate dehydrogenase